MTIATLSELPATHRRWRDLTKRRLLLGLAVAPVPSLLLGFLLIMMLGMGFVPAAAFGGILAAAETWSLIGGAIILLIIARWRGVLRRGDCFLLGIALAASLPFAAEYASRAFDWISGAPDTSAETLAIDDFEGPTDMAFAIILSILLLPFGWLGGWVFWRVGVRPAAPKTVDDAAVFD